MNNILKKFSLLFILMGLSFQSCLFQEEDIFDKPSAERMQEAIIKSKEILQAPKNGWLLEYCPGVGYSMGGINMLMKFDNEKVTLTSEMGGTLTPAGTTISTYYRIVAEQSVMLTFDTYNDVLHYFGEPQGSNANLQGDYEFIVMSATEEEVILQGKRYKNLMRMTPMPATTSWTTFITQIKKVPERSFLNSYDYSVDGKKVGTAVRSDNTNTFVITLDDKSEFEIPFIYTTKGFKLLKPLVYGEAEVSQFAWSSTSDDAGKFTSIDSISQTIELSGIYPAGYMNYDYFIGEYTMSYSFLDIVDNKPVFKEETATINLTRRVNNSTYTFAGIPNAMATPIVAYDRAKGAIKFSSGVCLDNVNGYYIFQTMGTENSYIPNYYGAQIALDGVIDSQLPLTIAFRDTGWGIYYFGEEASSLVFDAYTTASPSSTTFAGWAGWYRNIVITSKTN